MGNHVALLLTCVLNCVMVLIGKTKLWNTKHESVSGYEMLQVAIVRGGKCNYGADR